MLGSSVLPDLLETMQIVLLRSIFLLDRLDLRGIGGIQNVQLGEALDLAEGQPQNFRAKARAAHAEQQRMLELGLL